jgi:hypothetical protein
MLLSKTIHKIVICPAYAMGSSEVTDGMIVLEYIWVLHLRSLLSNKVPSSLARLRLICNSDQPAHIAEGPPPNHHAERFALRAAA